jgi:hypothetical protein
VTSRLGLFYICVVLGLCSDTLISTGLGPAWHGTAYWPDIGAAPSALPFKKFSIKLNINFKKKITSVMFYAIYSFKALNPFFLYL